MNILLYLKYIKQNKKTKIGKTKNQNYSSKQTRCFVKIIVPSLGAPTRSVSSQPSRCARRWSPGSPTSALTPRARTCAYLRPPPRTCVPTYARTHLRRHRELGKTKPLVEIRDIEYSYSKNLPQLEEKKSEKNQKKIFLVW